MASQSGKADFEWPASAFPLAHPLEGKAQFMPARSIPREQLRFLFTGEAIALATI
jgi:hypothetical protein